MLKFFYTLKTVTVTGHEEHVRCTGPEYMKGLSHPNLLPKQLGRIAFTKG